MRMARAGRLVGIGVMEEVGRVVRRSADSSLGVPKRNRDSRAGGKFIVPCRL